MRLIHIMDEMGYSKYTVHSALSRICKDLGLEDQPVQQTDPFRKEKSKKLIVVSEGEVLKSSSLKHVGNLRRTYPNAKIVILGGDSIYFHAQHKEYLPGAELCDLWLDLVDEVVSGYRERGITTDSWMWTTSQYYVEELLNQSPLCLDQKDYDFICLIQVWTHSHWRINFFDYLERNKFRVIRGEVGYEPESIHKAYRRTRFAVGTTSPSWIHVRTMKGFRDWIAPLCGTALIYDDHPDVLRKYTTCPIYEYDDISTIPKLYFELATNPDRYQSLVEEQCKWVQANTIEKQLTARFLEYKIL